MNSCWPGRFFRVCFCVGAFAVALLSSGCVIGIFPIPHVGENVGKPITANQRKLVQPSKTTRAEVLAQLGSDYVELPGGKVMAYSWEKRGLEFDWTGAAITMYGYSRTEEKGTTALAGGWQAFFVAYNDSDIVIATAHKHLSPRSTLHEQLRCWGNAVVAEYNRRGVIGEP